MKMPEEKGGSFAPIPPGTHSAICIKLLDIGTQNEEYQGQKKRSHKIVIGWELPFEKTDKGEPMIFYKWYTLSSNEKATLRNHLEAWRSKPFGDKDFGEKGFELKKLLGAPCTLVVQPGKDGAKPRLSSIGPLAKGTKLPKPHNDLLYFTLDDFDQDAFEGLGDGFKKIIMQSPEYDAAISGVPMGGATSSDEEAEDSDEPPF